MSSYLCLCNMNFVFSRVNQDSIYFGLIVLVFCGGFKAEMLMKRGFSANVIFLLKGVTGRGSGYRPSS